MCVVSKSGVVAGAKLSEEDLIFSCLDELVGCVAALRVHLFRPFVVGFRVDDRGFDSGQSS